MKHRIDPKVDCVFKALLGAEHNRRLLIHFLNAMLGDELAAPIIEVTVLNPYNALSKANNSTPPGYPTGCALRRCNKL